jgi:hypothetical protein
MTLGDFAEALGWQLVCRGVSFNPAEPRELTLDMWPLPLEDPWPVRWGRMFLVARRLSRAWGNRGRQK